MKDDKKRTELKKYIVEILPKIEKEASGFLKYPFLSVSYGKHYANSVFSWDNFHMALRFSTDGKIEYLRYLVDNLVLYQRNNGYIHCVVSSQRDPQNYSAEFHAQPFLAQAVCLYLSKGRDVNWSKGVFGKLVKYLDFWENSYQYENGLFAWKETYMGGFDNDAASSFLSSGSVISPDVNSWIYLEYLAMAKLAECLKDKNSQKEYKQKADKLKQNINTILWSEEDGAYLSYSIEHKTLFMGFNKIFHDLALGRDIGKYSFQSCSNFIPLYARIASQEQAQKMIERYLITPQHFWSEYGLRSLSRSSEYYNNAVWGNPPRYGDPNRMTNSNWQGPVWMPLCYFGAHALNYYGYKDKAMELAQNSINTLLGSLEKIGSFAENFDAETGKPLYCVEFASWNILMDILPEELNNDTWQMQLFFN